MIKRIILSIAIVLVNAISFGQTKEEKAVADAVEQLRNAMINADKTALEKLTAEKLSYGHSSGAMDDKKQFVNKLTSGASDFVTIDLSEQTISISDKVAVVRHSFKARTNDGGRPGEANIKVLLIWQKQKSGWKLLARQAFRPPGS